MRHLSERVLEAANTLEEISALYGYKFPDEAGWSASELRHEAAIIHTDTLQADYEGCSGHVYSEDNR